ncbi:MAG TPA: M15 family metallopeptidase [Actinoplanes sp.]
MPRQISSLAAALTAVLLLLLPPARPAAAATGGSVWHVVRPGETMASIAADFGLRTGDLARWNQVVKPYPVYVDETLRLNAPADWLPRFQTRVETVTAGTVNWTPRKRCPVLPHLLRRVWVSYIDFNGAYHDGSIIVRRDIVRPTQKVFEALYKTHFRIMAMAPMSVNMPGQTDMSIVTAGYNCRPVAGTKTWSQHSYGLAIDINPLQNPMIRGALIDPAAGNFYLNRRGYLIGMLHAEGAVRAFTANGFRWGGRWTSVKDYMHFSPTNR